MAIALFCVTPNECNIVETTKQKILRSIYLQPLQIG